MNKSGAKEFVKGVLQKTASSLAVLNTSQKNGKQDVDNDIQTPTRTRYLTYSTNEYSLFKKVKGNRKITERKVTSIIKSYEKGINLFPYCPVLVNKEMYIIDGQHRFEACKRLKLLIYYVIVPNFSLRQIAEINLYLFRSFL